MAYTSQTFEDGEVLYASELNAMNTGIVEAQAANTQNAAAISQNAEVIEQNTEAIEQNTAKNAVQYDPDNPPPYPVSSVNGKTGAVNLGATDVGARPNTWTPSAEQVGADPAGTAASAVSSHNTNNDAHSDIRLLIATLTTRLNALANSEDVDLDQMAELVEYIKDNRELIDQITTAKISYTDIINNLTTNDSKKPLSAAQGVALKALFDAIPSWAKQPQVPTYNAVDVGAVPLSRTINGKALASDISLTANDVNARSATWLPTVTEIGAVPVSHALTMVGVDANGTEYTYTIYGVNESGANDPE